MKLRRNRKLLGPLGHTGIERMGTMVLMAVLVLLIAVPPLLRRYAPRRTVSAVEQMNIAEFFGGLEPKPAEAIERPTRLDLEEVGPSRAPLAFTFDPNTISADSLLLLGLSAKQASAIVRYRVAGGQFRSPNDLAKLRAIDERTRQRLQPLVRLPATAGTTRAHSTAASAPSDQQAARPAHSISTPIATLELNTADTAALRQLRGIGPTLSQRIVEHRARLGGFRSIEQLAEVRGIKPDLIDRLRSQLSIDTALIRRIDLNTATLDQLRQHPYLTLHEAKGIIYYRSTMGRFSQPADLLRHKLVEPERYSKLRHYISTD